MREVNEEFLLWWGASKVGVVQPHQRSELYVCQRPLLPQELKSDYSWTSKTYQPLFQIKCAENLEDGVEVHLFPL